MQEVELARTKQVLHDVGVREQNLIDRIAELKNKVRVLETLPPDVAATRADLMRQVQQVRWASG